MSHNGCGHNGASMNLMGTMQFTGKCQEKEPSQAKALLLLIKQYHDPYMKLQPFPLNSTMLLTLTLNITE